MDYVYSLEFHFFTEFIQLKKEWMHTLFLITTTDREDPD